MKVYEVLDDYACVTSGIFSTKEKAFEYISKHSLMSPTTYYVMETEVDSNSYDSHQVYKDAPIEDSTKAL